jgi:hypothetical protein
MKIKSSRKYSLHGSTMVTTLIICSILSMSMAFYLSLVEQQNKLSFRSQAWNSAIVVTEAGIEDGLEQININSGTSLSSDGWSASGSVYTKTYPVMNGSYTATITPNPNDWVNPYSVTSVANVDAGGQGMLAAIFATIPSGGGTQVGINNNSTTSHTVARAVKVTVTRGNLLIKGMVARHRIDMHGNGIMTDSFDSTDPAYSTFGQYDSSKAKANGDIATNDGLTNSIGVGNANIYGHVNTGPGGSISVNNNGGVGTQSWVASNPGQIEPGYVAANANFTFPETSLPYTTGLNPSNSVTIILTNYSYSSNAVSSSIYPNPPPVGGVITNITYTTSSTYPGAQPGLVTNCASTLTGPTTFPAAGTYCGTPAAVSQGVGNGVKYLYYALNGYTWPVYTYYYNLYSTNVFSTTTNSYDNVLYSGDYVMDQLSGRTLVLGNARLVVKNGISMTGNDVLEIAQMGSLLMYVDGSSSTIGGNGVLNDGGYSGNLQAYFTKNTTSLQIGGNGTISGVFVAPDAAVTMNGGGRTNTDFIGALMGNTITMNGHFSFHYDEALGKRGATGRYIVSSWNEVKPN